tara:strand:- start:1379 stop:2236 length:858 start_codon:yes stop_codon:yes gene_type:complete
MTSIFLTDRPDRLGSNFVCKISDFIYGKYCKLDILYNSDIRFEKSMFTQSFIKLCKVNSNNPNNIIVPGRDGIRGIQGDTVIKIQQDLISYFKEHYRDELMNIIENIAIERNYKLPWVDSDNIIAIHLRCEDRAEKPDYNGSGSANYIKNLIETNRFTCYDRKKMKAASQDTQVCINPNKLENFIKKFKQEYPNKEIHVIYAGKPKLQIRNILNEYNIIKHSNTDPDYDLWLLMHSNILVASKSTYSMIAVYFFKGSKVYYPLWGTAVSCGLYTKYDKTNYEYYI